MVEDLTPRIEGSYANGFETVEPIVMRADYQLPWNRQSTQTVCGRVVQNQVGSKSWRIVIEGVMSKRQLDDLMKLRDTDTVTVITAEFGRMRVAFDQLNITRVDEEKWGSFDEYQGPLLSFQLQTKEDTEEGEGVEFFNENTRGGSPD